MTRIIPSGFLDSVESVTRNPMANLFVSWKDILMSGEWFRLDQSLMDSNALLTSQTYLQGQNIIELITDADAKVYFDESEYVMMLEGYSELIGDSYYYATSDLDFELDNTTNRFTPSANVNLLANPGFETNKTSWNESMGTGALGYIDEKNVRDGIRSYQLYNPNKNQSYVFSDRMETDGIADYFSYSQYVTGSGLVTLQLRSFGLSNSGVNNISTGLLGAASYQTTLVSGIWNRYSVALNVPSGAYYLRTMLSASGTWLRADDGKVEEGLVITPYDESFIGDVILPKKSVKLNVGFNEGTVGKFAGSIQKITPAIKDDTTHIYCYDWANVLKDKKIMSVYYENLRTDQLISNLAGLAGIDLSKMSLEVGNLTVDFAWFQEGLIWGYITQIAEAEGGIVFFDEEGILNFYNGTHFSTYPDPVYGFSFNQNIIDLGFEISKDKVKNRIEVKAYPNKKLLNKPIYNLVSAQQIDAGQTVEIWGQYNYGVEMTISALNVKIPIIGTDILANSLADGTGSNQNGNIMITTYSIFQQSIKVSIKNTSGATIYITKFTITGDPIVTKSRIELVLEDSASQALYNTQILTISNDFIGNDAYALTLATQKLAEWKNPLDTLTLDCVGAPFLRVGDIVSVQRSFNGVFENFQISKNRWSFQGDFLQSLELQKKSGISKKIYYPSNYILTENGEPILLENGDYLTY